jgi:hypothetical protein
MTACSGTGFPHCRGFIITHRHTTLDRTPLDEWSARRRDLYPTAHDAYTRQTSMWHRRDSCSSSGDQIVLIQHLISSLSGTGWPKFEWYTACKEKNNYLTTKEIPTCTNTNVSPSIFLMVSRNYNLSSLPKLWGFELLLSSPKSVARVATTPLTYLIVAGQYSGSWHAQEADREPAF